MTFADSAAATKGIHDLALGIKHIELAWGDGLRVDPLTSDLAVVAASYHEIRLSTTGLHVEETGFFTGIVEYRSWALATTRLPLVGCGGPSGRALAGL